jgi:hypothetical protein
MKNIIQISAFLLLLNSFNGLAVQDFPLNVLVSQEEDTDWNQLFIKDGVKVEFKYQVCNNATVSNQVLVLFRFTNTTNEIKTMTWSTKEYRNDICTTCNSLNNPEFSRAITLSPGEVLEGDGTSKVDKNVYIFSHFINLVPGMSDQKLTDFEFVNVEVTTYSN